MSGLIFSASKYLIKNIIIGYVINTIAVPAVIKIAQKQIRKYQRYREPMRYFCLEDTLKPINLKT